MLLMVEALLLISAALLQDHRAAAEGQIYPLDMALNSVDDQYSYCRGKMALLVNSKYLKEEINKSAAFRSAWQSSEKFVKHPVDQLARSHLIAIYVYTDKSVYKSFNPDVRSSKNQYIDRTYKWYSLHFLLTNALQILKKGCMKTYRGTSVEFNKDVLNKEIRFGSFASSSFNRTVAKGFGNKSCFEIYTCEGGYVAKYSKFPQEKEVLIPPYEKFRVTAVRTKQHQFNLWCNTVYTLQSTGRRSDLNCAAATKKSKKYVIH